MTSSRETKMDLKHLLHATVIYPFFGGDVLFALCRNAAVFEDEGRFSRLPTFTCSE